MVDAALLPEWNAKPWLDVLVVVDCEEGRARSGWRRGSRFSDADVRSRMKHQFEPGGEGGCGGRRDSQSRVAGGSARPGPGRSIRTLVARGWAGSMSRKE